MYIYILTCTFTCTYNIHITQTTATQHGYTYKKRNKSKQLEVDRVSVSPGPAKLLGIEFGLGSQTFMPKSFYLLNDFLSLKARFLFLLRLHNTTLAFISLVEGRDLGRFPNISSVGSPTSSTLFGGTQVFISQCLRILLREYFTSWTSVSSHLLTGQKKARIGHLPSISFLLWYFWQVICTAILYPVLLILWIW